MITKNLMRFCFSRSALYAWGGMSTALLMEFMAKLPGDAKFVGAGEDALSHTCWFLFESTAWSPVREGEVIPQATINFRRGPNNSEYCEGIEYPTAVKSAYGCRHSWVSHTGLNQTYNVCSMCGVKENP